MNGMNGENGLVPSLFVFEVANRFQMLRTDLPNQKERKTEISPENMEMNSRIAERSVVHEQYGSWKDLTPQTIMNIACSTQ
jgi:hypothetical protein